MTNRPYRLLGAIIFFTMLLLLSLLCRAEEIDINTIIFLESSGNPNAYNPNSGCIGLMGINPKGALADWNEYQPFYIYQSSHPFDGELKAKKNINREIYNSNDLYNPEVNVKIGTIYINERIPQMLKAYGIEDTVTARLFCYNAGIGNYRKYLKGEIKMPEETRKYIAKYRKLTGGRR